MVKKTISTLALCADRAFGVCTNKHDDYQTKRQVLNELLARELLRDRKRAASRLISPHGLVGRGEYREYGATAGRASKCESHRTTDTPQARETT